MSKEQLTGRSLENVHKIVFLANEYPGKKFMEIASMVQMGALDKNVAIWRAQDLGLITVNEDDSYAVDEVPDKWELGSDVAGLIELISYTFKRLSRDEMDLEENILGNWCVGYPAHDVMIAMKTLINDKVLIDYEIKNTDEVPLSKKAKGKGKKPETRESIYTFYTLYENMEMRWGTKQFKKQEELR